MDVSLSVIISAVGVVASIGTAWGMIKSTLTSLTKAIENLKDEFRSDLKEVKTDLKEAKTDLGKVKDKVNECERNIALVAQELSFRAGRSFKSHS